MGFGTFVLIGMPIRNVKSKRSIPLKCHITILSLAFDMRSLFAREKHLLARPERDRGLPGTGRRSTRGEGAKRAETFSARDVIGYRRLAYAS